MWVHRRLGNTESTLGTSVGFDECGAMGEGTLQVSVFPGGKFTTVFLADSVDLRRFTLVFSFLKMLLQWSKHLIALFWIILCICMCLLLLYNKSPHTWWFKPTCISLWVRNPGWAYLEPLLQGLSQAAKRCWPGLGSHWKIWLRKDPGLGLLDEGLSS